MATVVFLLGFLYNMAIKRIGLGNKIRFEVFRRDSFKCQYCGKSAPDIILNVDHINPVSKGGTNDIFNLITSCYECNQGKKARKLSEETEISKQKKQLDLLNERRNQLDMLLKWKTGLIEYKEDQAQKIANYLIKKLGSKDQIISESGLLKINLYLKKLTASKLIEIVDDIIETLSDSIAYFGITDKTFEIIFSMLHARYKSETATYDQKIQYMLKAVDYHYPNLNEKSWHVVNNSIKEFLENYPEPDHYRFIQKKIKEVNAQQFYDLLQV